MITFEKINLFDIFEGIIISGDTFLFELNSPAAFHQSGPFCS